ncbi:MAG: glycosyltransferase family 9 protein [Thermodesulfobacteriota bacterium]
MQREKILIIKLGYSETLVSEVTHITSLGDVLRSTVILPLFKDAHVTWLVDEKAISLLKGNPYIDRIMPYDLTSILQLQAESFDTVINLEKVGGMCAFADSLTAWRRYGFRFDPITGTAKAYDGSQHVLELCESERDKLANTRYWEEILFEMVGAKWNGEIPIIGYKPTTEVTFDVGFNHNVGSKWPLKAWPRGCWKELEALLVGAGRAVSWQKGLGSIEEYIDWLNSCELIVTNDSLGLHIAHALGKRVVALFGPSLSNEIYIKDGIKVLPEPRPDCLPCLSSECEMTRTCMYDISPRRVYEEVDRLLSRGSR